MHTIKLNNVYIPLVNRLLKIDNYDKMKTVLDIGLSGVDMIEKYSQLQNQDLETNLIFQEELKKYRLRIDEYEKKNEEIKKEKNKIEDEFFNIKNQGYNEREIVRKELENKFKTEIEFFRNQIKQLNEEKIQLIQTFEDIKNNEIEKRTKELVDDKNKLTNEIKYLNQLYVDRKKGTQYENELIPKFEEYNDKYLNNKWRILHIGSSCGHKCDFHIKNQDTGEIILIDTKNNESHKPVPKDDIDKFISDVTMIENNAIGGILIANNKICKKRDFDSNIINKKILYYVSNFSFDNIAYIFTLIEMICERTKNIKQGFDEESRKEEIIEEYNFLVERLNNIKGEDRKIEKKLREIKNKFYRFFNDDIELYVKGIQNLYNKMEEKVSKKDEEIIDFDKLEKGRKIIGKTRTKYYLQYKEDGKDIIQYFQNNNPKNKKIAKLKNKENIILFVDT